MEPSEPTTSVPAPLPEVVADPLPEPSYAVEKSCGKQFEVGNAVKPFELRSLRDANQTLSPATFAGRVVLLNFWGTWCKPCKEELPKFDRLYRKYQKYGFELVTVATDEDPVPVQAFVDEHKMRARVGLGGEDVAGAYDRPRFPFTFLVDAEGTIVGAYELVVDDCMGALEADIREQLQAAR